MSQTTKWTFVFAYDPEKESRSSFLKQIDADLQMFYLQRSMCSNIDKTMVMSVSGCEEHVDKYKLSRGDSVKILNQTGLKILK